MNIAFLRRYALFAGEELTSLTLLENQGYNNTNYLLESTKHHYLVRVFGKSLLERRREFHIAKKAFAKGISQEPLLLDSANNLMIIKFTKGEHRAKLTQRELQGLARKLRTLHSIPCHQKPYDVAKEYTASSKEPFASTLFLLFKKRKNFRQEPVLCHHDLNPRNILFHHHSITFIDWEYARVNDRYFDLASIVVEFGLERKETRFFVRAYFTCKEKIDFNKLALYEKIYEALCERWLCEYAHAKAKKDK
ncbi:MAG: phosphotransferase family protein [Campylobacterales bacterium]|nr:phosphotransferase family protein [Campylobacterales bacterium]